MPVNIKIIPSFPVKNLRKILYPFSLPYAAVTTLRNRAYDNGLLGAKTFLLPLIGVGNLSTGGTGKTPMTEYIVRLLKDTYSTGILSRGYGRKTTGFLEMDSSDDANRVGDEPLQFKTKFPNIAVAVDEKRVHGVQKLLDLHPQLDVIVLDDVFQHRSIRPGLMVLLTSYSDPFYSDLVLPAGNLRESRYGAARADLIVVTKCPPDLDKNSRRRMVKKIRKHAACPVHFATVAYDAFVFGSEKKELRQLKKRPLTVVTGIAKPAPFIDYLKGEGLEFELKTFGDHHNFSRSEIEMLDKKNYILTTEKDYVRLKPHLIKAQVYFLPIKHRFIDGGAAFDRKILDYVKH